VVQCRKGNRNERGNTRARVNNGTRAIKEGNHELKTEEGRRMHSPQLPIELLKKGRKEITYNITAAAWDRTDQKKKSSPITRTDCLQVERISEIQGKRSMRGT